MNYKSVTQLEMILGIGLLGVLTMLKPTPCRAQAEIDPDHYDTVKNEPVPQGKPTIAVSQKAGNFRGTFTLSFDVDYAGLNSPARFLLPVGPLPWQRECRNADSGGKSSTDSGDPGTRSNRFECWRRKRPRSRTNCRTQNLICYSSEKGGRHA